MNRMNDLSPLVQAGSLRHEVGHSVLHGALEYYVFPISTPLMEAAGRLRLSKEYSFSLLYLISIAVKDFEVTRLLSEKGFLDDQLAYSNHMLGTVSDDLDAWQRSQGKPAGMGLCLASRLKDAACLIALTPRLSEQSVVDTLRAQFSYLPPSILGEMLKTLKRFPEAMMGDTFQNVTMMTKIFFEDLLQPLFFQS
jgi:hypothetical protein